MLTLVVGIGIGIFATTLAGLVYAALRLGARRPPLPPEIDARLREIEEREV